MNRKGQALVEFILILPVFLLILLTIVDFGTIINNKNKLENTSTDIARLINNETPLNNILKEYPNIKIEIKEENNYKRIIVKEDIKIITPFLDKIIGNPYTIESKVINILLITLPIKSTSKHTNII